MSGTLVNVRIVIQNVRIIGQSEVEKVKASGSSAAGVRIVSSWGQDCHRLVLGSLPKVSGSSGASVRDSQGPWLRVRIVSSNVRIVSGESGSLEVSLSKAGEDVRIVTDKVRIVSHLR